MNTKHVRKPRKAVQGKSELRTLQAGGGGSESSRVKGHLNPLENGERIRVWKRDLGELLGGFKVVEGEFTVIMLGSK